MIVLKGAHMSKLVKISDDIRERARALYMDHKPMNDIAKELQVSTATLSNWRTRDGWNDIREAADNELSADIVSARKLTLTRIASAGIDQIERTIKYIQERPDAMSVAEAEKMAALISTLDKVHRLDTKQATENVSVQVQNTFSMEKVLEVIKADPFMTTTQSPPAPTNDEK